MRAINDVISEPAGQPRDWNRFRSLMAPGVRLIPTGKRPDRVGTLRVWTEEEYFATAGPGLERSAFFERKKGVNSFQSFFDGTRWWVVTIYWEAETPGNPIPPSLLNGK